jgi:hypothetical protein
MGTYARQMAVTSTIYDCSSGVNFRPLGSANDINSLVNWRYRNQLAGKHRVSARLALARKARMTVIIGMIMNAVYRRNLFGLLIRISGNFPTYFLPF